jgi:hypothetical protein
MVSTLNNKCTFMIDGETCAITVWGLSYYCQKQKMGKHFDDVLGHDVYWSSWRN